MTYGCLQPQRLRSTKWPEIIPRRIWSRNCKQYLKVCFQIKPACAHSKQLAWCPKISKLSTPDAFLPFRVKHFLKRSSISVDFVFFFFFFKYDICQVVCTGCYENSSSFPKWSLWRIARAPNSRQSRQCCCQIITIWDFCEGFMMTHIINMELILVKKKRSSNYVLRDYNRDYDWQRCSAKSAACSVWWKSGFPSSGPVMVSLLCVWVDAPRV